MSLPRALAQFNRFVNNPIQRRWAGLLPGYGIVEHVGRKSGKAYRTPVNVFRAEGGFVIWLGYGMRTDWLRNLQAADGGILLHRRKRYAVCAIRGSCLRPEGVSTAASARSGAGADRPRPRRLAAHGCPLSSGGPLYAAWCACRSSACSGCSGCRATSARVRSASD